MPLSKMTNMYQNKMFYLWIFLIEPDLVKAKYPNQLYLQYLGQDETVKELFEHEGLNGFYHQEEGLVSTGAPVYKKETSSQLFLYRNAVGQWTVSHYLSSPHGIIYCDENTNLVPLDKRYST